MAQHVAHRAGNDIGNLDGWVLAAGPGTECRHWDGKPNRDAIGKRELSSGPGRVEVQAEVLDPLIELVPLVVPNLEPIRMSASPLVDRDCRALRGQWVVRRR